MTDQQPAAAQEATLRDGRKVTIRPLTDGDRDAMLAFGSALPKDDVLYLELDYHNPNAVSRLVNAHAADNWRQLVAVADGQIVGYSNARLLPGWKSHVADVHLVVSEGWRGTGLGRELAQGIIGRARDLGVTKVIAEMLEGQTGGQAIFERLGFKVEGRLADHAHDNYGQQHTMLILGYLFSE